MKNYDLIYFVGDSWTVANNDDEVLPAPQPTETLFTYLVAKHFNLPYKVTAAGGVSNAWIHRQIYDDLPVLAENKNILLVIGYTCSSRQEIYYNNLGYFETLSENLCSKEFYERYLIEHFNWEYSFINTTTLIKSIRVLAKASSVDLIEAFAFSNILNVDFLNNGHVLDKNYLTICGDEGRIYNPKTGGHGHQNQIGNKKIADALIQKINEVYGTN